MKKTKNRRRSTSPIKIIGISLAILIGIAYLADNLTSSHAYTLDDPHNPPPVASPPPTVDLRIATQAATPYTACTTKFAIAKVALELPHNKATADKLARWENLYSKALTAWEKTRYNTSLAPQDADFSSRAYATYIRWIGAVMDIGVRWSLYFNQLRQMQTASRIPEVRTYYDCAKLAYKTQSSQPQPVDNTITNQTPPVQPPPSNPTNPPANEYVAPSVNSTSPYISYLDYDSRYPGYTVFYKIPSTAPVSQCKTEFASGLKQFNSADFQAVYRTAVKALSPDGQPFTWDNLSSEARIAHAAFSTYLSSNGDPFAQYNSCVTKSLASPAAVK